MSSVFDKDNQGRADKFCFAVQYGKDVAASQNQTAPPLDSIPVNPDYPTCMLPAVGHSSTIRRTQVPLQLLYYNSERRIYPVFTT
jgi:hypothetical protein